MSATVTEAISRGQSLAYGPTDIPLIEDTIGRALDRAASDYGDNLALVVPHQAVRWSYRQLLEKVERFAVGLIKLGLQKGDRLGIWAPNRVEWTVTQYAAAKLGLVLVNINPAYRVNELEYVLNKVACKGLVLVDIFKDASYLDMLKSLAPELSIAQAGSLQSTRLPHLRIAIHLGREPEPGFLRYEDVIGLGKSSEGHVLQEFAATLAPNDPINIQFTSGTTGSPKGATLSHRNLLNNAYFTGKLCSITAADSICVPMPLFHVFGMGSGNLLAMLNGATVVHPSEAFEPDAVLDAIERERCTSLYGVPTMFIAELAALDVRKRDLSSLRTGILAGAPVPMAVMRRVMTDMHMQGVVIGYGMTETSATIMITQPDDTVDRRVETVGRPAPHVEVKVVNERGEIVPTGQSGEICARGPTVMLGYWEDPDKTAEAIDRDGWLRTGDLGTLDEHGYGRIVGRLKEMVIRGGENIYPREIEEFLHRHPSIESAQVVGVPDEKYGEELCACIKLKPGAQASAEEIRAFCKDQIAHYKIPRYVRFVEVFPMTASGKVQKYLLVEDAVAALGLERLERFPSPSAATGSNPRHPPARGIFGAFASLFGRGVKHSS